MATQTPNQRETQDQSIKARKKELYIEEEVVSGPRKSFREYLRETPSAPLSRNVKLMLWGSAAPVLLLFLGSLLTGSRPTVKAPEHTVLPLSPPKAIAQVTEDQPPKEAIAPKEEPPKDEAQAKENPPEQEKPKKPKKPSKPKAKPKTEGEGDAAASTDKADKTDEAGSKAAKSDKTENGSKGGDADKRPNPASSNSTSKGKEKAKAKDGEAGSSTTPAPEKKRPSLFRKKKEPVYTYPKREGKKDEPDKTNP